MKEPIKGMRLAYYPVGDVSQFFGENPTLYKSLDMIGHSGIDVVRQWGERMYAVEDGTVVEVKSDPGGYGEHVRIVNNDCTHEWTYGHCSGVAAKLNQKVKAGDLIATMGNTGFVVSGDTIFWKGGSNITSNTNHPGTHLHLTLRLIEKSRTGWSYPGTSIKFHVLNYDNGFKGAVDPVPYLRDQSLMSTKAENLARAKGHKGYMQASVSLRMAGF